MPCQLCFFFLINLYASLCNCFKIEIRSQTIQLSDIYNDHLTRNIGTVLCCQSRIKESIHIYQIINLEIGYNFFSTEVRIRGQAGQLFNIHKRLTFLDFNHIISYTEIILLTTKSYADSCNFNFLIKHID